MALKKKYSVRWRLFLPTVIAMWLLVGMLMAFQYHRETEYRKELIDHQLNLISSRIIAAYEDGSDIKPFLDFISRYLASSALDEIKVSVYDADDKLEYAIGVPFRVKEDLAEQMEKDGYSINPGESDKRVFYFKTNKSDDGKLTVHTAMPWTASLTDALKVDDTLFYAILILAIVLVMVFAFISTGFITNNIKVLREFARNANNPDFVFEEERLGHDELGDISRDIISLYRQRAEALEQSEKEHAVALHAIEEKSRVQHQLTNNINHELKTPVGVIRGYLETVLTSEDMDADTQRYFLKRALDNVERLCSLLYDVSTMARLESGAGKIPLAEIGIHDLVYTVHNDLKQAGALGDMKVTIDIPLECTVLANATLLNSAITNLMRNAIIHSHGTEIGINLVSESEKFYTFAFWDNGNGVSEEHIPHLFERFYRVDAGRSRKTGGGTGLGLPIVKSAIDSMGGALSVYNRSKGGLEFLFTLKKVY